MSSERRDEAEDRALGMDRPIARRDFLQGLAFGAAALGLPGGARAAGPGVRTALQGMLRGQDPEATALGHRLRR